MQVRNKELHAEGLKAVGADEVLSTADDDVPGRVKELTGATVHGVDPCSALPFVASGQQRHVTFMPLDGRGRPEFSNTCRRFTGRSSPSSCRSARVDAGPTTRTRGSACKDLMMLWHLAGGRGVWGAVDPVAGPYAQTMGSMVRDGGQLVVYSRLGGMTANVGVADLLYRRVTVRHGSSLVQACLYVASFRLIAMFLSRAGIYTRSAKLWVFE